MILLEELAIATGLPIQDLDRIIDTAPRRYKVFYIPKKHGGFREIAHPARELKALQRIILDRYLQKYPVHSAAMAYAKGRNIKENAECHKHGKVILKLDFVNFFPSIKVSDWKQYLKRQSLQVFASGDIDLAAKILFWGNGSSKPQCLSIGAPTSPMLSNLLLYDLDTSLAEHAAASSVHYSRYADDITVSAQSFDQVLAFERVVRHEVAKMKSPRLRFNNEKRGVFGSGQRRMVTGLVLTPDHEISIGRERKRLISALLHRYSVDVISIEQRGLLKGLLGFAISNEPDFVNRMRKKYGDSVVDESLRYYVPRKSIS